LFQSAVIDCASLVYMSHLQRQKPFFHYLQNLFHTLYFPSEVINEYAYGLNREPHRDWILQRLKPEQGFYRHCNSYDSLILSFLNNHKGIDKGEAEAYAQLKKVNANLIISDDKEFIAALKHLDASIKVYTTIHIICWLEHSKLISNWKILISDIHKFRPFSSNELRQAYIQLAEQLGLHITKAEISSKCSLTKILNS
jgi:predicted nucleic acid-binding protein